MGQLTFICSAIQGRWQCLSWARRWAKKAARNAERRAALKEAEEKEGFALRCAAKEKAKEFAEQWIPCAERAGALCYQLQRKDVKKWAKDEKTTVMYQALERMSILAGLLHV